MRIDKTTNHVHSGCSDFTRTSLSKNFDNMLNCKYYIRMWNGTWTSIFMKAWEETRVLEKLI